MTARTAPLLVPPLFVPSLLVRSLAFLPALLLAPVHADDKGLRRGANPATVTISGVSAGAAMAVQYAVAHSASIKGVGSIAGPPWGCADGSLYQAVDTCMCGKPKAPTLDDVRKLAQAGAIDALTDGRPGALDKAYVFQSRADETVVQASGNASAAFLRAFADPDLQVDTGDPVTGADKAAHGIVSPEGKATCNVEGDADSYIRLCCKENSDKKCEVTEDNAGKLLLKLKAAPNTPYNAGDRQLGIPDSDVWEFRQTPIIEAVKATAGTISSDSWFPWLFPDFMSKRRASFDMADKGYIYVPPACRNSSTPCDVHIALHGCKQDALDFAKYSGYNNWAEHYKTIIVYPAIAAASPVTGNICKAPPGPLTLSWLWGESNPNGCWDWWGYLDLGTERNVTKQAPQIRVIRGIIEEVTRPLP